MNSIGTTNDVGPLITIIIFAILFFALLIAITYYLYLRNRLISCQNDPNIWCFNDWTCNVSTPVGTPNVNVCFTNGGTIGTNGQPVVPPGLVNCIIGPNSQAASVCLAETVCDCDIPIAGNCFEGCPGKLNETTTNCKTIKS